jgi:hypothetical protein
MGEMSFDLQFLLAFCVKICCRLKLKKSLGVKLIFHSAFFARSLAKASSPGIPITDPDRNSSNLRFASKISESAALECIFYDYSRSQLI